MTDRTDDDPAAGRGAVVEATVLEQAAREVGSALTQGWEDVRGGVLAAVRASARTAWPVLATMTDLDPAGSDPAGPDPAGSGPADAGRSRDPREQTHVSERVLRDRLSRAVSETHRCALAAVDLELDGDALRATVLDIVGPHGEDLLALGEKVRRTALQVLGDLLGPTPDAAHPGRVDVHVADVTLGDPRLS